MASELGLRDTNGILRQPWVRPRRTSAGLGWDRIYVSTQRERPYQASFDPAATHLLILHLNGPVTVRRGHARLTQSREVLAGGLFLHPAGSGLTVELGGELDTVHAYLADAALQDAHGGDRPVTLAEELGIADPLLEQLMLSLDGVVRCWEPSACTYADYLAGMLAAQLARRHSISHADQQRAVASPGLSRRQLAAVRELMEQRLAQPLPLAELAAADGGGGPGPAGPRPFTSPEQIRACLLDRGYLADDITADAVFLADRLGRPLLVEGPAGVGKTELAKTVAATVGARLIRLQCYEGLDEAKTLYEWDYRKQLLWLQAAHPFPGGHGYPTGAANGAAAHPPSEATAWHQTSAALFSEGFLLARPLLQAILADDPAVLLIDEIDRVEAETEALMLEVLSDFQVTVPELGTLRARSHPLVFLTSNGTRELSEALRRRCLFLPVGYPDTAREAEILRLRVPEIDAALATQIARIVRTIRQLDLRKPPSLSETIDWARTLALLGIRELDGPALARTMTVLLKQRADLDVVHRELAIDRPGGMG